MVWSHVRSRWPPCSPHEDFTRECYRVRKNNDVQGKTIGFNKLFIIVLTNDNLSCSRSKIGMIKITDVQSRTIGFNELFIIELTNDNHYAVGAKLT